ncbi:TonB-dependent receptor plug domain-containing protein, partial [Myxacorys almedinensis]
MSDRRSAVCVGKKLSLRVRFWLLASLSGCVVPVLLGLPAAAQSGDKTAIAQLSQVKQPAKTVKEWLAQVEAATVQITQVQLNPTATGLEIVLETQDGKPLQVDATKFRSEGNALIADIPNAVLTLPQGQTFTAENPTVDVTNVQVVQQDINSIRISVTGNNALPKTEVTLKTGGLAYSLNPEADEPDEEIVVTGERGGYRVPNTSVGTRTDTPLRDIPQSIQIIPQEVLRDQNVTNFNEAVRNVPGVIPTSPTSNANALFIIRGFSNFNFSNSNILRNGLRQSGGIEVETNPDIERIEVLLGPASVLYGGANPGGTINIVTKQPLREPFYAIDATIGNYDFYRATLDLSGPLNDSGTVLYRLNAGYLNRGNFIDFARQEGFTIAPVVSFALGERTRLIIEGDYIDRDILTPPALPAEGTVLPNPNGRIPRNRFTGNPEGIIRIQQPRVGYRFEHQFNDNWSLQNAFQFRRETAVTLDEPLLFNEGLSSTLSNSSSVAQEARPAIQQGFWY